MNTGTVVGFDVTYRRRSTSPRAFAALQPSGGSRSSLYRVDLGSGRAQRVGSIGGPTPLRSLTSAEDLDDGGRRDRDRDPRD